MDYGLWTDCMPYGPHQLRGMYLSLSNVKQQKHWYLSDTIYTQCLLHPSLYDIYIIVHVGSLVSLVDHDQ